ncbi:hypothetical protein GE21DRAFT_1244134, partial [Neurospora crassa]
MVSARRQKTSAREGSEGYGTVEIGVKIPTTGPDANDDSDEPQRASDTAAPSPHRWLVGVRIQKVSLVRRSNKKQGAGRRGGVYPITILARTTRCILRTLHMYHV